MLNSNFDLRKFLTESKAPTEQVQEAILTEATVMEYIREKMDSMNNEVRSCMREYLNAVNEIDPGHEDAHAQLMGALEDFYNKLKAHFEQDAADEDPMPGDEEPPVVLPSDAPSRELDGSPMIEGEEEDEEAFGGEEDELEERTYFDPYDELEEEVNEDHSDNPNDKYVVRPCKNKEEPWAVWEGETRVKGFATKEEAQEFADKKNKEQGLDEAAINENIDTDTVNLLLGLAKTAVNMGTVPAALAVLYQFRDNPKIAKAIAAFERHLDK